MISKYMITKSIFHLQIMVDWSDESIMYYDDNNGNWSENLQQAAWSFQNKGVQKDYEVFLQEISDDDQLLEFIANLELDEEIMTLSGHKVVRID